MAESEEELKSLLMKVKEESEKTIRVVVFHRRPARPADPAPPPRGKRGAPGASHLFYTSHVSSPCQTRVKLNRVSFPADSAKPVPLAVVSLDSR